MSRFPNTGFNAKPARRNFKDNERSVRGDSFHSFREYGDEVKKHQRPFTLKHLHQIGIDGIDHINIFVDGNTDLGCALSNSAVLPFEDIRFGRFKCVEGLWNYLKSTSRESTFRDLSGIKLHNYVRRNQHLVSAQVPNFVYFIAVAILCKVQQNPELLEQMKNSTLPFDLYYLRHNQTSQNKIPERPKSAFWLVEICEKVRDHVKGEPQNEWFDSLIDDHDDLAALDNSLRQKTEAYNSTHNQEVSSENIENETAINKTTEESEVLAKQDSSSSE